jgi:hypothetical protein
MGIFRRRKVRQKVIPNSTTDVIHDIGRDAAESGDGASLPNPATEVIKDIYRDAAERGDGDIFEIEIVGEGYRQKELERIAGPKEPGGKQHRCGVTLRREPSNKYDENAVRAEVMGVHVGYVARELAYDLAPAMQAHAGGIVEARGVIVGGWDDGTTEGYYGIRAWLTEADFLRLHLEPDDLDVS